MKGMTLIETLIYIALLSILMIGVLSSVYTLMASKGETEAQLQADSELLIKTYHE